jgi:NAD(P)-dependent dehydrogenase (short-subunit alcohol dehydrogenase family)
MPVAVLTGASQGLGLALAVELDHRGWDLVVDARGESNLRAATSALGPGTVALAGDVTDPAHVAAMSAAAADLGGADLLVNNASTLGASPLPAVEDLDQAVLTKIYATNVVAPVSLIRALMGQLVEHRGTVVNITSDAAVEASETWGGYGSSKAALDHLSAVLAAERPRLRVYAFDPGDMRTQMHQDAFPGEDISDRAEPATVVPALLRLLQERRPSGRYRASDLLTPASAAASA